MGKAAQGAGNIRKRADGRWEARYSHTGPDGKSQRRSIFGKTQREVREGLTAALRAIDQGEAPITERQTVGQFLDRWLTDVAKPTVRPKTYHSYAALVRLHLAPALGHHRSRSSAPSRSRR